MDNESPTDGKKFYFNHSPNRPKRSNSKHFCPKLNLNCQSSLIQASLSQFSAPQSINPDDVSTLDHPTILRVDVRTPLDLALTPKFETIRRHISLGGLSQIIEMSHQSDLVEQLNENNFNHYTSKQRARVRKVPPLANQKHRRSQKQNKAHPLSPIPAYQDDFSSRTSQLCDSDAEFNSAIKRADRKSDIHSSDPSTQRYRGSWFRDIQQVLLKQYTRSADLGQAAFNKLLRRYTINNKSDPPSNSTPTKPTTLNSPELGDQDTIVAFDRPTTQSSSSQDDRNQQHSRTESISCNLAHSSITPASSDGNQRLRATASLVDDDYSLASSSGPLSKSSIYQPNCPSLDAYGQLITDFLTSIEHQLIAPSKAKTRFLFKNFYTGYNLFDHRHREASTSSYVMTNCKLFSINCIENWTAIIVEERQFESLNSDCYIACVFAISIKSVYHESEPMYNQVKVRNIKSCFNHDLPIYGLVKLGSSTLSTTLDILSNPSESLPTELNTDLSQDYNSFFSSNSPTRMSISDESEESRVLQMDNFPDQICPPTWYNNNRTIPKQDLILEPIEVIVTSRIDQYTSEELVTFRLQHQSEHYNSRPNVLSDSIFATELASFSPSESRSPTSSMLLAIANSSRSSACKRSLTRASSANSNLLRHYTIGPYSDYNQSLNRFIPQSNTVTTSKFIANSVEVVTGSLSCENAREPIHSTNDQSNQINLFKYFDPERRLHLELDKVASEFKSKKLSHTNIVHTPELRLTQTSGWHKLRQLTNDDYPPTGLSKVIGSGEAFNESTPPFSRRRQLKLSMPFNPIGSVYHRNSRRLTTNTSNCTGGGLNTGQCCSACPCAPKPACQCNLPVERTSLLLKPRLSVEPFRLERRFSLVNRSTSKSSPPPEPPPQSMSRTAWLWPLHNNLLNYGQPLGHNPLVPPSLMKEIERPRSRSARRYSSSRINCERARLPRVPRGNLICRSHSITRAMPYETFDIFGGDVDRSIRIPSLRRTTSQLCTKRVRRPPIARGNRLNRSTSRDKPSHVDPTTRTRTSRHDYSTSGTFFNTLGSDLFPFYSTTATPPIDVKNYRKELASTPTRFEKKLSRPLSRSDSYQRLLRSRENSNKTNIYQIPNNSVEWLPTDSYTASSSKHVPGSEAVSNARALKKRRMYIECTMSVIHRLSCHDKTSNDPDDFSYNNNNHWTNDEFLEELNLFNKSDRMIGVGNLHQEFPATERLDYTRTVKGSFDVTEISKAQHSKSRISNQRTEKHRFWSIRGGGIELSNVKQTRLLINAMSNLPDDNLLLLNFVKIFIHSLLATEPPTPIISQQNCHNKDLRLNLISYPRLLTNQGSGMPRQHNYSTAYHRTPGCGGLYNIFPHHPTLSRDRMYNAMRTTNANGWQPPDYSDLRPSPFTRPIPLSPGSGGSYEDNLQLRAHGGLFDRSRWDAYRQLGKGSQLKYSADGNRPHSSLDEYGGRDGNRLHSSSDGYGGKDGADLDRHTSADNVKSTNGVDKEDADESRSKPRAKSSMELDKKASSGHLSDTRSHTSLAFRKSSRRKTENRHHDDKRLSRKRSRSERSRALSSVDLSRRGGSSMLSAAHSRSDSKHRRSRSDKRRRGDKKGGTFADASVEVDMFSEFIYDDDAYQRWSRHHKKLSYRKRSRLDDRGSSLSEGLSSERGKTRSRSSMDLNCELPGYKRTSKDIWILDQRRRDGKKDACTFVNLYAEGLFDDDDEYSRRSRRDKKISYRKRSKVSNRSHSSSHRSRYSSLTGPLFVVHLSSEEDTVSRLHPREAEKRRHSHEMSKSLDQSFLAGAAKHKKSKTRTSELLGTDVADNKKKDQFDKKRSSVSSGERRHSTKHKRNASSGKKKSHILTIDAKDEALNRRQDTESQGQKVDLTDDQQNQLDLMRQNMMSVLDQLDTMDPDQIGRLKRSIKMIQASSTNSETSSVLSHSRISKVVKRPSKTSSKELNKEQRGSVILPHGRTSSKMDGGFDKTGGNELDREQQQVLDSLAHGSISKAVEKLGETSNKELNIEQKQSDPLSHDGSIIKLIDGIDKNGGKESNSEQQQVSDNLSKGSIVKVIAGLSSKEEQQHQSSDNLPSILINKASDKLDKTYNEGLNVDQQHALDILPQGRGSSKVVDELVKTHDQKLNAGQHQTSDILTQGRISSGKVTDKIDTTSYQELSKEQQRQIVDILSKRIEIELFDTELIDQRRLSQSREVISTLINDASKLGQLDPNQLEQQFWSGREKDYDRVVQDAETISDQQMVEWIWNTALTTTPSSTPSDKSDQNKLIITSSQSDPNHVAQADSSEAWSAVRVHQEFGFLPATDSMVVNNETELLNEMYGQESLESIQPDEQYRIEVTRKDLGEVVGQVVLVDQQDELEQLGLFDDDNLLQAPSLIVEDSGIVFQFDHAKPEPEEQLPEDESTDQIDTELAENEAAKLTDEILGNLDRHSDENSPEFLDQEPSAKVNKSFSLTSQMLRDPLSVPADIWLHNQDCLVDAMSTESQYAKEKDKSPEVSTIQQIDWSTSGQTTNELDASEEPPPPLLAKFNSPLVEEEEEVVVTRVTTKKTVVERDTEPKSSKSKEIVFDNRRMLVEDSDAEKSHGGRSLPLYDQDGNVIIFQDGKLRRSDSLPDSHHRHVLLSSSSSSRPKSIARSRSCHSSVESGSHLQAPCSVQSNGLPSAWIIRMSQRTTTTITTTTTTTTRRTNATTESITPPLHSTQPPFVNRPVRSCPQFGTRDAVKFGSLSDRSHSCENVTSTSVNNIGTPYAPFDQKRVNLLTTPYNLHQDRVKQRLVAQRQAPQCSLSGSSNQINNHQPPTKISHTDTMESDAQTTSVKPRRFVHAKSSYIQPSMNTLDWYVGTWKRERKQHALDSTLLRRRDESYSIAIPQAKLSAKVLLSSYASPGLNDHNHHHRRLSLHASLKNVNSPVLASISSKNRDIAVNIPRAHSSSDSFQSELDSMNVLWSEDGRETVDQISQSANQLVNSHPPPHDHHDDNFSDTKSFYEQAGVRIREHSRPPPPTNEPKLFDFAEKTIVNYRHLFDFNAVSTPRQSRSHSISTIERVRKHRGSANTIASSMDRVFDHTKLKQSRPTSLNDATSEAKSLADTLTSSSGKKRDRSRTSSSKRWLSKPRKRHLSTSPWPKSWSQLSFRGRTKSPKSPSKHRSRAFSSFIREKIHRKKRKKRKSSSEWKIYAQSISDNEAKISPRIHRPSSTPARKTKPLKSTVTQPESDINSSRTAARSSTKPANRKFRPDESDSTVLRSRSEVTNDKRTPLKKSKNVEDNQTTATHLESDVESSKPIIMPSSKPRVRQRSANKNDSIVAKLPPELTKSKTASIRSIIDKTLRSTTDQSEMKTEGQSNKSVSRTSSEPVIRKNLVDKSDPTKPGQKSLPHRFEGPEQGNKEGSSINSKPLDSNLTSSRTKTPAIGSVKPSEAPSKVTRKPMDVDLSSKAIESLQLVDTKEHDTAVFRDTKPDQFNVVEEYGRLSTDGHRRSDPSSSIISIKIRPRLNELTGMLTPEVESQTTKDAVSIPQSKQGSTSDKKMKTNVNPRSSSSLKDAKQKAPDSKHDQPIAVTFEPKGHETVPEQARVKTQNAKKIEQQKQSAPSSQIVPSDHQKDATISPQVGQQPTPGINTQRNSNPRYFTHEEAKQQLLDNKHGQSRSSNRQVGQKLNTPQMEGQVEVRAQPSLSDKSKQQQQKHSTSSPHTVPLDHIQTIGVSTTERNVPIPKDAASSAQVEHGLTFDKKTKGRLTVPSSSEEAKLGHLENENEQSVTVGKTKSKEPISKTKDLANKEVGTKPEIASLNKQQQKQPTLTYKTLSNELPERTGVLTPDEESSIPKDATRISQSHQGATFDKKTKGTLDPRASSSSKDAKQKELGDKHDQPIATTEEPTGHEPCHRKNVPSKTQTWIADKNKPQQHKRPSPHSHTVASKHPSDMVDNLQTGPRSSIDKNTKGGSKSPFALNEAKQRHSVNKHGQFIAKTDKTVGQESIPKTSGSAEVRTRPDFSNESKQEKHKSRSLQTVSFDHPASRANKFEPDTSLTSPLPNSSSTSDVSRRVKLLKSPPCRDDDDTHTSCMIPSEALIIDSDPHALPLASIPDQVTSIPESSFMPPEGFHEEKVRNKSLLGSLTKSLMDRLKSVKQEANEEVTTGMRVGRFKYNAATAMVVSSHSSGDADINEPKGNSSDPTALTEKVTDSVLTSSTLSSSLSATVTPTSSESEFRDDFFSDKEFFLPPY